jgi:transketolase
VTDVAVSSIKVQGHRAIRDAYGETLVDLGEKMDNLVVLEADVGSSTKSALFGKAYPERYFNVGIAEGNMAAMAAGFAACGKIPFINTFAVFAMLRAADPLRTLIAYTGLNVKIAGAYGGLSDSYDGATHQAVEDIAIARAIPNITVVVPTDAVETEQAVWAVARHNGPVYLRLSRAVVPTISDATDQFAVGKARRLRKGSDVSLIACGYMVHKALEAAGLLQSAGIDAGVIAMPTIKPLDQDAVLEAARTTGAIATIEEHTIHGGLGSAVAELLSQSLPVPMEIIGIPDRFGESGEYEGILAACGLDADSIAARVKRLVRRKP